MVIGTSCTDSERRCAVTVTVCTPPRSLSLALLSAASAAKQAPWAPSAARTAAVILRLVFKVFLGTLAHERCAGPTLPVWQCFNLVTGPSHQRTRRNVS